MFACFWAFRMSPVETRVTAGDSRGGTRGGSKSPYKPCSCGRLPRRRFLSTATFYTNLYRRYEWSSRTRSLVPKCSEDGGGARQRRRA